MTRQSEDRIEPFSQTVDAFRTALFEQGVRPAIPSADDLRDHPTSLMAAFLRDDVFVDNHARIVRFIRRWDGAGRWRPLNLIYGVDGYRKRAPFVGYARNPSFAAELKRYAQELAAYEKAMAEFDPGESCAECGGFGQAQYGSVCYRCDGRGRFGPPEPVKPNEPSKEVEAFVTLERRQAAPASRAGVASTQSSGERFMPAAAAPFAMLIGFFAYQGIASEFGTVAGLMGGTVVTILGFWIATLGSQR
jgi:hypothetical protein